MVVDVEIDKCLNIDKLYIKKFKILGGYNKINNILNTFPQKKMQIIQKVMYRQLKKLMKV